MKIEDGRTVEAYDVYYEVYDAEISDFWKRFPENIVDLFNDNLPGKKVLNLGSGTGRDSLLLRERGLEVTCFDGSPNMVHTTEKLGFRSILGDIRSINLPDVSFDGIWAYSSLIHVTTLEMKDILLKLHRILKKDGLLLLGLIQGTGNETLAIGGSEFARYFEYYDHNKIEEILKDLHFRQVFSEEYKPGNHVYLNYILQKYP